MFQRGGVLFLDKTDLRCSVYERRNSSAGPSTWASPTSCNVVAGFGRIRTKIRALGLNADDFLNAH